MSEHFPTVGIIGDGPFARMLVAPALALGVDSGMRPVGGERVLAGVAARGRRPQRLLVFLVHVGLGAWLRDGGSRM